MTHTNKPTQYSKGDADNYYDKLYQKWLKGEL